ncbi:MAG: hypothetical protein IT452_13900 [Planctomycetia bacterium]|nr:hypothetical protein [Planctomycetia bacterium]
MDAEVFLAIDLEPKRQTGAGRLTHVVCAGRQGATYLRPEGWHPGRAIYSSAEINVELQWRSGIEEMVTTNEDRSERMVRTLVEEAKAPDRIEVRGLPHPTRPPFWISRQDGPLSCFCVEVEIEFYLEMLWDSPDVRMSTKLLERALARSWRADAKRLRQPDWPDDLKVTSHRAIAQTTWFDSPEWLPVEASGPAVLHFRSKSGRHAIADLYLTAPSRPLNGTDLVRNLEVSMPGGHVVRDSQRIARILSSRA